MGMIRGKVKAPREVILKRIVFGDIGDSPFVEGCDGKWYHRDTRQEAKVYTLTELLGECDCPVHDETVR